MKGFKINKKGIQEMTRELEKEFSKNPIKIPVCASHLDLSQDEMNIGEQKSVGVVNNFTINAAPHSQLAVNAHEIHQEMNLSGSDEKTEEMKDLLTEISQKMDSLNLSDEDELELSETISRASTEFGKQHPDKERLKDFIRLIKRILSPLAMSSLSGASTAVGDIVGQWVHQLASFLA